MHGLIIEAIARGGYFGIFVLMVLENVFPPIPSELILPFAGFLVGIFAGFISPIGDNTAEEQIANLTTQRNLSLISPSQLFTEATKATLSYPQGDLSRESVGGRRKSCLPRGAGARETTARVDVPLTGWRHATAAAPTI